MILEGRSGPSHERVHSGIDVAMMGASTLHTRPVPYLKHAQSAGTCSAPTSRARQSGKLGINLDIARTAYGRFVRQHTPKLGMAGTGHALAKLFRHTLIVVLTEVNRDILRHQPPGELMVSILPSIACSLLDARRKFHVMAALRLRRDC